MGQSGALDRKGGDGCVFLLRRYFGLCREVCGVTILKWALETWMCLLRIGSSDGIFYWLF
jgi:hypothetical protein